MSYRLINANALAANCRQVNDMPCIYVDLPNGLDGNYYVIEQSESNRESRWHELFGTPEIAARTLAKHCDEFHCVVCPAYHHGCGEGDYYALLEWLGGDAE